MKDSDQAIEKVLAGLRDAEAPAGMERRILETVQSRAFTRSRWGWLRIGARPVIYAGALAGVVALVLMVPASHQPKQAFTHSAKIAPSTPISPAPSATVAENAEPQRPTMVTRSSRRPQPRKLKVVDPVDPEESLAVREMNAPSRPAPPLPLTEQEKLLVRFVRTRTPEELATIDPVKWAAHDQQERAEFDKFFGRLPKDQLIRAHPVKGQSVKEKPAEEALNSF